MSENQRKYKNAKAKDALPMYTLSCHGAVSYRKDKLRTQKKTKPFNYAARSEVKAIKVLMKMDRKP